MPVTFGGQSFLRKGQSAAQASPACAGRKSLV
ncbi:hypothetical protein V512_003995 [Mesotoga sp. Brook.08.105.5.1]|nr:hypothetical protein V512_003995 [Mesotoga sp. Brook.08.105.5.1]RAO96572.1 hypothetical protein M388_13625 [Mesotoga sp. Brook.08.YT.4.2.5.4.]